MGATPTRTTDGRTKVQTTSKPDETMAFFTGACDDTEGRPGCGGKIIFDLANTDATKEMMIGFAEVVYLAKAHMWFRSAPLGASVDAFVIDADENILSCFCRVIPLFGDNHITLESEDNGVIPIGCKLKVVVHNSSGEGDEEQPTRFKVSGFLKLFRKTTI